MPQKIKQIYLLKSVTDYAHSIKNVEVFLVQILKRLGFEIEIIHPKRLANLPTKNAMLITQDIFANLDTVLSLAMPKIAVYHNMTPYEIADKSGVMGGLGIERQKGAVLNKTANRFSASVGVSKLNSSDLKQTGHKNIHTIPALVDYAKMLHSPYDAALLKRLNRFINIVFVGRYRTFKGQMNLLKAFATLLKTHPEPHKLRLHIPGWVNEMDYYKQLVNTANKYGIAKMVSIGYVDHPTLCAIYRSANLYVSLSEHEGFGMPLIEAALHSVPVVALGVYAIPDTMGKGGLLINTSNPSDVARVMKLALEQPTLRRKMLKAQRQNLVRFDEQKIAIQWANLLKGIGVKIPKPPPKYKPPTINPLIATGNIPTAIAARLPKPKHSLYPPLAVWNFTNPEALTTKAEKTVLYNCGEHWLPPSYDLIAQPTPRTARLFAPEGFPVAVVGWTATKLAKTAANNRILYIYQSKAELELVLAAHKPLAKTHRLVVVAPPEEMEPIKRQITTHPNATLKPHKTPLKGSYEFLVAPNPKGRFDQNVIDGMATGLKVITSNKGAMEEFSQGFYPIKTSSVENSGKGNQLSGSDGAGGEKTSGEGIEITPKEITNALRDASKTNKAQTAASIIAKKATPAPKVIANIHRAMKLLDKMPLISKN